jgi:phospholipid transport system substrate-binding protein
MLKKIAAFIFLTILGTTAFAALPTPTDQLKSGVATVLDLLNDKSLEPEKRNLQIEEIVRARFDFDAMSQWILGTHWRKASAQEKERFKDLFTQLLEANYRGRIGEYADQYTDERIDYLGERIIEDRALVDTQVVTKDRNIPISYKMVKKGGEWKIYDVVIEEVSLVRNFRNTYDEIIRKDGLPGLFKRMEQKIADLHSGKIAPAAVIEGPQ